MEFNEYARVLHAHIQSMCAGRTHLFEVALDKEELWQLYLSSFAPEDNAIYRKRREHDCFACRSFIKAFGNVVAIVDGKRVTIWDITGVGKYQRVVDALAAHVRERPITDVFVTDTRKFGIPLSRVQGAMEVVTWQHMHAELPASLTTYYSDALGGKRGELRDTRNVLKRSLDEITIEATETLLELIAQGSLYKGEEWQAQLQKFAVLQRVYETVEDKELYCWDLSLDVGPVIGRIRSKSIGTLLVNLSEGMPLDQAVRAYEAITAPSNYKRPKAIFTERMRKDAEATAVELGIIDSLPRRYALLDDITVNNILFANRDAQTRMAGGAFDGLQSAATKKPAMDFSKLEEVDWKPFVDEILPAATSVELYLEGRHMPNMVSLIAPQNAGKPTLFKWDNPFSWAYAGNITDSMKEQVKAAGGNVEGVLRFSIRWSEDGQDNNDLDAHCIEPCGNLIYFNNMRNRRTGGELDVDIRHPVSDPRCPPAVENITWPTRSKMSPGVYKFVVHNFAFRGGRDGFSAEIEFDGQIFSFEYPHELRNKQNVQVAKVTLLPSGEFRLKECIPAGMSGRDVWGLKTNEFHPVTVAMYSPNYWDNQHGIGHRHLFFMLDKCINPEQPNGFFNEFLPEQLMKHKRVFEALGSKMRVPESADQLSGVGFSTSKRNSAVCRIGGRSNRTIKVRI